MTCSPRSVANLQPLRLCSEDIAALIPILDIGLRTKRRPRPEERQCLHVIEDTFASAVQALQERRTCTPGKSLGGSTTLSQTERRRPMTASAAARRVPSPPRQAAEDKVEAAAAPSASLEPEVGIVGVRLSNQAGTIRPVRPQTAPNASRMQQFVAAPANQVPSAPGSRPTSSRPPSGKLRHTTPAGPRGHSPVKSSSRQADDDEANIVSDDGADVDAAVENQWASIGGARSKREQRRQLRDELERREKTTAGTAGITVVRDPSSALTAIALGGSIDVPSVELRGGTTPRGPSSAPPPRESYFSNFRYSSIDAYLASQKKTVRTFYGNKISAYLDVHKQLQDAQRPELPTPAAFSEQQRDEELERLRKQDLQDPHSAASMDAKRVSQLKQTGRLVQPLQATVTARRVRSALGRRPGTHKF